MSDLPAWVHQLVDGLMTYDAEHPKLFAQFYPTYEYQPADCPCHLLARVPGQARLDAWNYMNGVRAATEQVRAIALRWVDAGEDSGLEEILAKFRDAFPQTADATATIPPAPTPDRSDTHEGEEAK